LGVVAQFREQIRKNHMRQNVGKKKSTCFGIFYKKIALFQVMNFIPVTVSTLYVRDLLDELNFILRSGVALPFDRMLD
jgi:hypothetical protein